MKIALLDDYQGVALSLADWASIPGGEVESFRDHVTDIESLVECLHPFECIVAMRERTPLREAVLSRLPNLKLLITTGSRNPVLDIAYAQSKGITVCNTGGDSASTVELTWALILAAVRNLPFEDASMRRGNWQTTIGPTLEGKTLGCVGLGNLGGRVAKIGQAFGMNVIAWSTNLTAERCAEIGARLVSKQELMSTADVITVHLVLSDRSRNILDAPDLALMKRDAYLVNTSRGPLIKEAALLDTLQNHRIAGAALDVYDEEPLPSNHPLRDLDNVVLSPHLGYVTSDNFRGFFSAVVEDVVAFQKGAPIRVLPSA